jgi:hypothetical protein
METRRTKASAKVVLATAFLTSAVALTAARQRTDHCATQPPPQGLVERCRSKVVIVPNDAWAFRFVLTEWMRTCVSSERAPAVVYGNQSLDEVWKVVQNLPQYARAVTIYPGYEPLTFTQNGKTCYGVKSVEFRTTRTRVGGGTPVPVRDDPDPPAPPKPPRVITDEMIKEAAAAAKRALAESSDARKPEVSQLLGALDGLQRYGKTFDDTYFPVAPFFANKDFTKTPAACFTEYRARSGGYECLPTADAVQACARHLADDVVQSFHFDEVTQSRFTEILEIKANDIQRGLHYLTLSMGESEPAFCTGVTKGIKPKVEELNKRGKTTLYGYY